MTIMCVAGARPNFMKMKPVIAALERRGATVAFVHTGQHYDQDMSQVFLDELDLRPPDHALAVGSGTHAAQTAAVMAAMEPLIESVAPTAVVVAGDVNSTMAAALVAAKAGALVAHVEAGLRSRDWSMPEEVNRVVTDRVSDLLLAPSDDAVANLTAEGYRPDQVHLVGNVMVDTLLTSLARARRSTVLDRLGVRPGGYGLVTLHRPGTVDDPATLGAVLGALAAVAARCPLVFPVHPRTRARLHDATVDGDIRMTPPLGYLDFLALEASAALVLTDSGGVQEETTALGVPCLTLRPGTERPVTVAEGTNVVVGHDPERILAAADDALAGGRRGRRPALWDGHAGDRIAGVLLRTLGRHDRPRPTDLPVTDIPAVEAAGSNLDQLSLG